MNKKTALNALWVVPTLLLATLLIGSIVAQDSSSVAFSSAYPPPPMAYTLPAYPPPSMSPTPVPLPPKKFSAAAHKALEHTAKRDGIPVEVLIIQDDHPTEYPSLGRKFQVVTLLDTRPEGKIYKLLVDLANDRIEEDDSALLAAEARAYQSKYGKLQPALYERLQTLADEDTLPVAIWIAPQPGKTLADLQEAALSALAAKYPEARAAIERSGKPMDVDDPELAHRIETEYFALLDAAMKTRSEPLITELRQRKFTVNAYEGMPSFTAVLPKSIILELTARDEVGGIYLIEKTAQPELDSAVPNTLAPTVWGRGYTGSGVTIAILEHGNVDPHNSFLHLSPNTRAADNGVQDHTTRVASDAASFHTTYKGVAPQATILSAGENGTQGDVIAALQWAIVTQTATIVNCSEGYEADNNVNWIDRAFDYWARQRFRLSVKSAGNTGGSLTSPGKGWNVLTVGAYNDNNNTNWSDDQMWASSSYINPVSAHSDREKPEVVAVGVNVTALGINNVPQTRSGTSHAAPQVAGLAALLISRELALNSWPEAQRAIIMASATHNINGPSIIVWGQGDLCDGAGGVNADLADGAAQLRGSASSPSYSSCWWGDYISNSNFPVGTELTRSFYVGTKSLIRVALAWWANADTPTNNYSFSRLDTDLDLRVKGPDGQWVPYGASTSYDNNYEMVEFFASQPGQYQIVISKIRADEPSNYLGTALVMIPLPYSTYLPVALKDY